MNRISPPMLGAWRGPVWQELKLPDDKVLIPGFIAHASSHVEHPGLSSDRLVL